MSYIPLRRNSRDLSRDSSLDKLDELKETYYKNTSYWGVFCDFLRGLFYLSPLARPREREFATRVFDFCK